jgi:hypothetical protein
MIPEKLKSAFIKYRGGWLAVGLACAFIVGTLAIPNYISGPVRSSQNACINNLRQIDGAKLQWALENHLDSNATPTWANIQPYLGRGPEGTREGRTYTVG